MGHQAVKSGMIVLLYCLLVCAGVTWAFDVCFDDGDQLSHAASDPDHDANPASNSEPAGDSPSMLQCAVDLQIADESYTVKDVRLNAVFKRNTLLSLHGDLPYRLFLSILQI